MEPVVERIANISPRHVGEGPHWDLESQVLYMVDCGNGHIIKHIPATNETIYHKLGDHVSFIIPVRGRIINEFIVGSKLEILHIKWDTDTNQILKREVLADLSDRELPNSQVNDANCDAGGRLWFGTLGKEYNKEQGSMYSFTKSKGLVKQMSNICLSNGLGFSSNGKKLFFVDTMKKTVSQYDVTTGLCQLDKVVVDFERDNLSGLPDGMTVDADDKIWLACPFGAVVLRIDPDSGKTLQTIHLAESPQPTSVAWGGPNREQLFIVTGNIPNFPGYEHICVGSELGATYRVTGLGTKGLPQYDFNMDL